MENKKHEDRTRLSEKFEIIANGIIKENPVLALLLGLCPSLAVTTTLSNGVGMGLSTTFVLICSNIVISILKNVIPDKVRIPCYIVVISGFVIIIGFLLEAYLPDLNKALGLYIPLIVVNCIILGRAEMYANKHSVLDSALDGIGMGLGFTLALAVIGSVRELLGAGTLFGMAVTVNYFEPMSVFMLAPGGFFVLGCLIALINFLTRGKGVKKKEISCGGCAGCNACENAEEGGCQK